MTFSQQDEAYMRLALALAARARCRTHPNPMVGCVIVRNGQVVGTGYHRRAGEPHAEALALQKAGDAARGATVYVTLEPCAHWGRTPPCADALIRAGVSRVVAAMADPDSRVAGRGLQRLRNAGICAECGLLEPEARALNRAYLKLKATGRPLVILKWAMTLDGRIACASGDSRWITSDMARNHVHQVRDQVDAILVGAGTALRDDPELTARPSGPGALPGWAGGQDPGPDPDWRPRDPLRIVLDSAARLPVEARLLSPALQDRPCPGRTLVAVTRRAPPDRMRALEQTGAEVLVLPEEDGSVALEPLLEELGRRGIGTLLVEGGGRVHGSFLARGLADYVMAYVAPKLVGGAGAPGPVEGAGLQRMADAWPVADLRVTPLGADLLLEGALLPR